MVWLIALGCTEAEPYPVLDPWALSPVAAEDDPLREHRPVAVDCPPAAWGPEGGGFEVQTGVCTYAAFDQPLPRGLHAGDQLEISVWYDTLDTAEPGDGHVAVWVGDQVVWEDAVAIPGPSDALEATVDVLDDVPEQGRLGIHLHNHGFNSWRFVEVVVHPR